MKAPKQQKFSDPLIDQVRETRAKLVKQYGGLRGWCRHLQQVQKKLHKERAKRLVHK